MYKIASKVTCNECALVPGKMLATRLCAILFLLDLCCNKNESFDLLLIGADYIPYILLAQKVFLFFIFLNKFFLDFSITAISA